MVHVARHVLFEVGPVVRVEGVARLLGRGRGEEVTARPRPAVPRHRGPLRRHVCRYSSARRRKRSRARRAGRWTAAVQACRPGRSWRACRRRPPRRAAFPAGARGDVHAGNALGEAALPAEHRVVAEVEEHAQLLLEQGVVVREIVAEQRIGLDERAAAGNDLGPAVGDQVQRGELFEEPHGVLGGQHRHGRAQPKVGGFPGDGRQHDFRRREGEVVAVVLAQAHEAEACLVRQLGELDHLLQPLMR